MLLHMVLQSLRNKNTIWPLHILLRYEIGCLSLFMKKTYILAFIYLVKDMEFSRDYKI